MTITFNPVKTFAVGIGSYAIATADFNADRNPDLVSTNLSSRNISVLLGDGAGSFADPVDFDVGYDPFPITVGDFNNDSFLDLALSTYNSRILAGQIVLMLGDGAGNFTRDLNLNVDGARFSIVATDLDNDGILDLAAGSDRGISLFLGDGAGSLSDLASLNFEGEPKRIVDEDLNHDGNVDLVTGTGDNFVSVLLGDGSGSVADPINFAVEGIPAQIAVGDFNNDNCLDLASINDRGSDGAGISVLSGDGTGSFAETINFKVDNLNINSPIATVDINHDGNLDLLTTTTDDDGSVLILLGDGASSFAEQLEFSVNGFLSSIIVEDFNHDGLLDIAGSDGTNNEVSVLINSTQDPLPAVSEENTLTGSKANDFLYGGSGNDAILGFAGDDILLGSHGRDTLNGGMGNDVLIGDNCHDFVLAGGEGKELIFDFAANERIGLSDRLSLIDCSFAGSDLIFKDEVMATLIGVDAISLIESDFTTEL